MPLLLFMDQQRRDLPGNDRDEVHLARTGF